MPIRRPYSRLALFSKTFVVWVCDVSIHRLIHQNTVRIAACVAFLVCSLLGRPLHQLQHLIESAHCGSHEHSDALKGGSANAHCHQSCGGHQTCPDSRDRAGGSDRPCEPHKSGDGIPEHSHDSHSCSVCQALCVAATSPDYCVEVSGPEVVVPLDAIDRENVIRAALPSTDARGPPYLA